MIEISSNRSVYTRQDTLTPELRVVGWTRNPSASRNVFPPHFHKDAYEIHFLLRGRLEVMVANKVLDVRAGHLIATLPDEPHSGIGGTIQQCEFVWMQFDRNYLQPDVEDLLQKCVERRVVRIDLSLAQLVMQLLNEHKKPDPYSTVICRGLIKQFLVGAARSAENQEVAVYSPLVEAATRNMQSNISNPPTLQSLSKELGVSIAHLTERFRLEIGETPAKWLLQERINRASELLLSGTSTRQIAQELGFSTAQNFATTFRREMGVSPSSYRDLVRRGFDVPLSAQDLLTFD